MVSIRFMVSGPVSSILPSPQTMDHPAWSESRPEVRELLLGRVVILLGLLLGIEVVEVSEELVEAVVGRKKLVPVAEVVLAELPGGVALLLQPCRDGWISRAQTEVSSGHTHLSQSSPIWILSTDERCPTCRAALLAVVVGETHTFRSDPINIWRAIAHQSFAVTAQIRDPDIVAPDHQNVRPIGRHGPSPRIRVAGRGKYWP
jgi:hypothetical protein